MFSKKVSVALFVYWMPLLCYSALIFYLSHQSDPTQGVSIPVSDKVLHFIEFAVLGFLAVRAFCYPLLKDSWHVSVALSVAYSVLYAAFDEWHQSFIPGRIASGGDLVADTSGALLGIFLWVRCFLFQPKGRNRA